MVNNSEQVDSYDAVVVGAGFAGLYMLYRLRAAGFSVRAFEAGDGVGGTWYWNRYPGARCDVESVEYSYSFSPELEAEWEWTERFATQPEILRYLNHVADRFSLRPDIQLRTAVTAARYDEAAGQWDVTLDDGTAVRARYVVMATGCLSTARTPDFAGLDSFRGATYHTGHWPAGGVDFTGQRVGVIGTGSSGVQVIPLLAQQAAELFVFQRTPNFTLPARNAPLDPGKVEYFRAHRAELREQERRSRNGTLRKNFDESAVTAPAELREQRFEHWWAVGGSDIVGTFRDLTVDQRANDLLADFLRGKIREIVRDPDTAAALSSQHYPVGAKRVCLGTDYYETFNRDNVRLVDLREAPLESLTPAGIRTSDREYGLDSIVFATGFDAMTGSILRVDIHGRDGRSLRADWAAGPHTYLGLACHGYPNLFLITGPGSPSVLSNVVVSIEQHVEWVCDHLEFLRKRDLTTTEAAYEAQEEWVAQVNELAGRTLMLKAASWYLGANVPGKPRVFMPFIGGVGRYREICEAVAADDYRGFVISPTQSPGSLSRDHGRHRVRDGAPYAPGLPQLLPRTSGDPHDVVPVLARSRSAGRSAPGAEGTGKAREPPADGDRNPALASEGLSRRQPETDTTDNTGPAGTTTGHPQPPAPVEPPTPGANHAKTDKFHRAGFRMPRTILALCAAGLIELSLCATRPIRSGPVAPKAGISTAPH